MNIEETHYRIEEIKEFMWKTLTDEQKSLFNKVLAGAITREAPLITHLAPRAALKIEINLIPIDNEEYNIKVRTSPIEQWEWVEGETKQFVTGLNKKTFTDDGQLSGRPGTFNLKDFKPVNKWENDKSWENYCNALERDRINAKKQLN